MLDEITGDRIWSIVQGELDKGNKPATVNRYLALIRCLMRTARDEWQWIDTMPKIRLLHGEVERDRWLTRGEAERLIAACSLTLRQSSGLDSQPDAVRVRLPAWNGIGWISFAGLPG